MKRSRKHSRTGTCSGMALPMVLWAIALLTGVVLLLAGIIGGWMDEETRAGKAFRARQQALSGIAVAMSGVEQGDPLLNQQSDGEEGYKVVIKDESGLINPNSWLTDHRDLFKKLFTAWGLPINDSDSASDGLFDWQSPNPFRSLHGAKKAEYDAAGKAGLPPNAPFLSPDEMELVIGFAPVMRARPDWKDLFTTYNPGKTINLLRAPKEILTGILELTPTQADSFITLRAGKDGIEGTADDNTNAVTLLPLNPAQKKLKETFFGTDGKVLRIESTGTCNGVTHLITAIVDPEGTSTNNPQSGATLLGWTEK